MRVGQDQRDAEQKESVHEIHIAKHRNGPVGRLEMYFDKRSASFRSLVREKERPEIPTDFDIDSI